MTSYTWTYSRRTYVHKRTIITTGLYVRTTSQPGAATKVEDGHGWHMHGYRTNFPVTAGSRVLVHAVLWERRTGPSTRNFVRTYGRLGGVAGSFVHATANPCDGEFFRFRDELNETQI